MWLLFLSMLETWALVNVYTDGSVLVSHDSMEMGQGLQMKFVQITASSFNIPINPVFI